MKRKHSYDALKSYKEWTYGYTCVTSSLQQRENKSRKRKTTEEWLERLVDEKEYKFRYFITLSFNKQQTSFINQYLENRHIKRVILDFFYPNRKPENCIRLWFFVEPHLSGDFTSHILTEGMDGLTWFRTCNRKVTFKKSTLQSHSR